ncbi:MAG: DNA (cytosine-5-)-methyltransferase [Calditrichaeota bacterium]|nr:MAG: DNA (cytosine-5-)-methyltransferase [Calditrichota bacterium]
MQANDDVFDLLSRTRQFATQKEIADRLGVSSRTVKRWEARESSPPPYVVTALQQLLFPEPVREGNADFTFADLFAGIGGIRLGFEAHGGRCVFTSEWNRFAQRTYRANFPDSHPIEGDIRQVPSRRIPDHDVLLAGFPCQPFSIAGVSKKNALGQAHGFACRTQGTLFFDVARIIADKRPAAFLLENVKNLQSHDRGKTFRIIMETLTEELGYDVHYRVLDARRFVPQHRERILIAGFREPIGFSWDEFRFPDNAPTMRDVLHPEDGSEAPEHPYTLEPDGKVAEKYVLSDKLWTYLQEYARKHRAKGNGFGFGLVGPDDVARTLSARYYKDGSEILVQRREGNPRRLTPRECARLMGFDRNGRRFSIPVSDTQAYRQFGNAVVVPVIEEAARIMKPYVMELINRQRARDRATAVG